MELSLILPLEACHCILLLFIYFVHVSWQINFLSPCRGSHFVPVIPDFGPLVSSQSVDRCLTSCFTRRIASCRRSIRRTLITETTTALVNALVISRIDYCNAVLAASGWCTRHSLATTPRSSQCSGKTNRPKEEVRQHNKYIT